MRPMIEQLDGLAEVSKVAQLKKCNCAIVTREGDVAVLVAAIGSPPKPGYVEIVYASGGYDLWQNGKLCKADLSVNEAASLIIDDYVCGKARIVASRGLMSFDEALAYLKKERGIESGPDG